MKSMQYKQYKLKEGQKKETKKYVLILTKTYFLPSFLYTTLKANNSITTIVHQSFSNVNVYKYSFSCIVFLYDIKRKMPD